MSDSVDASMREATPIVLMADERNTLEGWDTWAPSAAGRRPTRAPRRFSVFHQAIGGDPAIPTPSKPVF